MADAKLPEGIDGHCDAAFRAIPELLARQLETGGHHGVAVAVRHRGRPVVDVWGGRRHDELPWSEDTMALSFSTTKGPAALALHMALERAGVGYDTPVSSVWPEFGKDGVTIRHVLSHEAGIPQIRGEIPDVWAMCDWELMTRTMERLHPLWEPGTENGYHALNFGWLVGELVRRLDGRDLPTFLAEEVSGPLGLDGFYIGTPRHEHHRVALLHPAPRGPAGLEDLLPERSLAWRALSPDGDMLSFVNTPQGLSTCGPAFSGVFTARSLAKMYSVLERGGTLDGVRLVGRETVDGATRIQNKRRDLVLGVKVYWRLGFMSGGSAISPAGPNREAYGHAGYGGSLALADPRAELAVAIVLDRLEVDLLGGDRTRAVVHAAVAAVG